MFERERRITTSAMAVILKDDRLLTVVKEEAGQRSYILPGGRQEFGETLETALQRECLEEIGIEVEVQRLLFVREYIGANHEYADVDGDVHIVNVMFLCIAPDDYVPRSGLEPDAHQEGVAWLPVDELDQHPFFPQALKAALQSLESQSVYLGDVN